MADERSALCSLCFYQGMTPGILTSLLNQYQSYVAAIQDQVNNWQLEQDQKSKFVQQQKNEVIKRQLDRMAATRTAYLTWLDVEYPSLLKNISSPPPVLFYQGDLALINTPAVAVVGTRKPTVYTEKVIEHFVPQLVHADYTVISGFQKGVDQLAHKQTIQSGGKTVAVLGTGILDPYPANYREMYAIFQTAQTLILSEFPFFTRAFPQNFPRRNRIVSALSQGVLVVEASLNSGSLNTANHALEQGKEVWCVPGSIFSEKSSGPHYLIQQGASLVQTISDMSITSTERPLSINRDPPEHLRQLFELISNQNTDIDGFCQQLGSLPSELVPQLSELEITGMIKKMSDGTYIKV